MITKENLDVVVAKIKGWVSSQVTSAKTWVTTNFMQKKDVKYIAINTSTSPPAYCLIQIHQPTVMMAFTITQYTSYTLRKFVVSGYDYSANHWFTPAATKICTTGNSFDVKFGYTADNYLWVAIPNGMYPSVMVSDILFGFNAGGTVSEGAITLSFVDTLPGTLQTTITVS